MPSEHPANRILSAIGLWSKLAVEIEASAQGPMPCPHARLLDQHLHRCYVEETLVIGLIDPARRRMVGKGLAWTSSLQRGPGRDGSARGQAGWRMRAGLLQRCKGARSG